jgi:hypothetical protein
MGVMKPILALVCFASLLAAAESLNVFGHTWTITTPASDWAVSDNLLQLKTSSEPTPGQPRRPTHFALLDTKPYSKVTVEGEFKPNGRSLIIVYAYQNPSHFNYAHMSSDNAVKQNVHNGMFHVFGGERVRMSSLEGPASFPAKEWTPVKLVWDGATGLAYVEVNGKRNPSLTATDMSLKWGQVGLGSFDETGDFRNIKVTGTMVEPGEIGR